MTLQQLRYALTIAGCGSMNEAAKRLFLSQPSLSWRSPSNVPPAVTPEEASLVNPLTCVSYMIRSSIGLTGST